MDTARLHALIGAFEDKLRETEEREARALLQSRLWFRQYEVLEGRVAAIERSLIFRFLRWIGRQASNWKARLGQKLLHSPFHPLYLRLAPPPETDEDYERYFASGAPQKVGGPRFNRKSPPLEHPPCFSILLACHDPKPGWLHAAIDSVSSQSYEHWELCICDDGSRQSWVKEHLESWARSDHRIRYVLPELCTRSAFRAPVWLG